MDPPPPPSCADKRQGHGTCPPPDERRRLCTPHDFLAAHLDPAYTGAGPVHGYSPDHPDGDRLYCSFRIAEYVVGVSIGTTYRNGHYRGSLGSEQLRRLERTLSARSPRSYDTDGRPVRDPDADDAHVLVFSHHRSPSMTRRPDAARTDEPPHGGAEVIALLVNSATLTIRFRCLNADRPVGLRE